MQHPGLGLIYIVPAVDQGPETNVNILQIGKMILVKTSQRKHCVPAVQGGTAAGRKDPDRFQIAFRRLPLPRAKAQPSAL